jgi:hypothetical protein
MAQVVVGGTVAALAAADALAGRGRPVRLLLPRKGVGGGFTALERGGHRLELGMRVLELRYEGTATAPPLEEYRPEGDGHRPFVGLIDSWVRELVGADRLLDIDEPASFVRGRLGPEVLLTSDLTGAADLVSAEDARRIAGEAATAVHAHGPAGWLAPGERPRLWEASLDEASLHQHGRTFHDRLIAPLIGKMRAGGGSDVPAVLRRKLWMPLFWPQTVAEVFSGQAPGFVPDRPLTVVRPGGMGPVVEALLARLRSPHVELVPYDAVTALERDGARLRIELSDGRVEVADRPIVGVGAAEVFGSLGIPFAPTKVQSVFAWTGVQEVDVRRLPGYVHVLDADVPAYRITPGELDADTGTRVLCVELSFDVAKEAAAELARDVLQRVGLVREGAPTQDLGVFAGPSFTDPTADNLDAHARAVEALRERSLPASVIGGAQAFGFDSFNEQVIQGLQAAHLAD